MKYFLQRRFKAIDMALQNLSNLTLPSITLVGKKALEADMKHHYVFVGDVYKFDFILTESTLLQF